MPENKFFKNLPPTRETQVMILASEGFTDKQISTELGISTDTVSTYWRRILARYHANSRTEVIAKHFIQYTEESEREKAGLKEEIESRVFNAHSQEVAVARLTALMNQIKTAVLFESDSRKIVFANKGVSDLFGPNYEPSLIIGRDSSSLLEPFRAFFDRPYEVMEYMDRCTVKETETEPLRIRAQNGRIIEVGYAPVRTDEDRISHLWHISDVSASVAQEQHSQTIERLGRIVSDEVTRVLGNQSLSHEENGIKALNTVCRLLGAAVARIYTVDRASQTFSLLVSSSSTENPRDRSELEKLPLSLLPWWTDQSLSGVMTDGFSSDSLLNRSSVNGADRPTFAATMSDMLGEIDSFVQISWDNLPFDFNPSAIYSTLPLVATYIATERNRVASLA